MHKNIKILLIPFLVVTYFLSLSSNASAFSGSGSGTSGSPYIITSCSQFMEIDDNVSQLGAYYSLSTNLDCTSSGTSIVMGTSISPFEGNFDGNNYTITIDIDAAANNIGLFGYTEGATISDLNVAGTVTITGGYNYIGGVIGRAESSTITDVHSTVSVTTTSDHVGGLVGLANDTSITSSSHTSGNISGDDSVGGLVGEFDGTGTISQSYVSGNTVTGSGAVGGLVGYNASTISNSYANSSVTGDDYIGGLVGDNAGTITNSYSTGSVTLNNNGTTAGGFVGLNESTGTITNSFTTSTMTIGTGTSDYGGFIGRSDANSYTNSGWYTGSGVSNAIGNLTGTGAVTNITYNESSSTAFNDTDHAIYGSWNFSSTWTMCTLPSLSWQTGLSCESDDDSAEVFEEDERCVYARPVELTWLVLKPEVKDGVSGMHATWTQYGADKVTIRIDDGSGNYPWKIEKTTNDGHEFLPNVQKWQKVKIKAHNECKSSDYNKEVSYSLFPNGWYNIK